LFKNIAYLVFFIYKNLFNVQLVYTFGDYNMDKTKKLNEHIY